MLCSETQYSDVIKIRKEDDGQFFYRKIGKLSSGLNCKLQERCWDCWLLWKFLTQSTGGLTGSMSEESGGWAARKTWQGRVSWHGRREHKELEILSWKSTGGWRLEAWGWKAEDVSLPPLHPQPAGCLLLMTGCGLVVGLLCWCARLAPLVVGRTVYRPRQQSVLQTPRHGREELTCWPGHRTTVMEGNLHHLGNTPVWGAERGIITLSQCSVITLVTS